MALSERKELAIQSGQEHKTVPSVVPQPVVTPSIHSLSELREGLFSIIRRIAFKEESIDDLKWELEEYESKCNHINIGYLMDGFYRECIRDTQAKLNAALKKLESLKKEKKQLRSQLIHRLDFDPEQEAKIDDGDLLFSLLHPTAKALIAGEEAEAYRSAFSSAFSSRYSADARFQQAKDCMIMLKSRPFLRKKEKEEERRAIFALCELAIVAKDTEINSRFEIKKEPTRNRFFEEYKKLSGKYPIVGTDHHQGACPSHEMHLTSKEHENVMPLFDESQKKTTSVQKQKDDQFYNDVAVFMDQHFADLNAKLSEEPPKESPYLRPF